MSNPLKINTMAKIYGLNGVIRGRQGNNVFSVQNGVQVLKAYQPAVSNPRTDAQRQQRAKFALCGRISGITPVAAIQGIHGGNIRDKRARFVSKLLMAAVVSGTPDALVASVPYAQITFSEGSLARYSANPSVTAGFSGTTLGSFVDVSVGAMTVNANRPDGYGELVIVCLYDGTTSELDEIQVAVRSLTESSEFKFRQGLRRNAYVVSYVAPFVLTSERSRGSSSLLNGLEDSVSINVNTASVLSGAVWGVSQLISNIPVLGAQTSVAPAVDNNR